MGSRDGRTEGKGAERWVQKWEVMGAWKGCDEETGRGREGETEMKCKNER